MNALELETLLHQEIPITKSLEIRVLSLAEDSIVVEAPLEPNRNIHQTGFAGSIYSVATLAGWSLLTSLLDNESLTADVVMASANIRYRRPLRGPLQAHCHFPDAVTVENFLDQLRKRGKARMELEIEMKDEAELYAVLNGRFAALGTKGH